MIFAGLP